MSRINIHKIANLSGISTGTVSRVLTGKNDVNSQTRDKIISIIKKTGFIPQVSVANRRAVALLRQPDVVSSNYPFEAQSTDGMLQASFNCDYDFIVVPIPDNIEKFNNDIFLSVLRRGIQGVIIHQPTGDAGMLDLFRDTKIKTVVYQGKVDDPNIGWVDHDSYDIMYRTLFTFKEYGYKHAYFVGRESTYNHSVKERFRAIKEFSSQNNFEVKWLDTKDKNEEMQINMFMEIFSNPELIPCGITGSDSSFIPPLYRAFQLSGFDPVGKIGIVGVDNERFYPYLNPPISTIVHPYFEMGQKVFEMAVNMINGQEPSGVMLKSELMLRKSMVPVIS